MNNLKSAGVLFFLAGGLVLMGIITAEAFYPSGYSTFGSEISDLGSTRPPNSLIYQPSSSIFNGTMLIAGLMLLLATIYQYRDFKKVVISIPLMLLSLGLVGVGIFPGNLSPYHGICAMIAFLSGGISAVLSSNVTSMPIKYMGIMCGTISLTAWFSAVFVPNSIVSIIGLGGLERWVAYPIILWLVGFGGYLMNKDNN